MSVPITSLKLHIEENIIQERYTASYKSKICKTPRQMIGTMELSLDTLEIDRAILRFRTFLYETRGGRADFLAKRNSAGKKVERARCNVFTRFSARRSVSFTLLPFISHCLLLSLPSGESLKMPESAESIFRDRNDVHDRHSPRKNRDTNREEERKRTGNKKRERG